MNAPSMHEAAPSCRESPSALRSDWRCQILRWFGARSETSSQKAICGLICVAFVHNTRNESDPPQFRQERLLDSIAHRGPDAAGEWQEEGVYLGHRRLSIIDLATGDQPMQSWDGRYVIVFNGEIYNFPELREILSANGAKFQTRSDTEVIIEAYRQWGSEVVNRLHGMFAFVVWDRYRRSAFGARDRIGIKPLCWASLLGPW